MLPNTNPARGLSAIRSILRKATLDLNFTRSEVLDPRITFSRTSNATRTNAQGLIETVAVNQPRFDYDPVTLAPKGLLIEEQRSNLLTYSEQFDSANWSKTNTTVTPNATTAPDGNTTADSLIETAATGEHNTYAAQSYTSGASYTLTVYAKKLTRNYLVLSFGSAAFGATTRAWFDLNSGVVGTLVNTPTASIQSIGNGWYRCSITKTASVTTSANTIISVSNADNVISYTGDGTSGIYIWGAQLETGSFATSYMPTVASQVTRAADVAVMTGTNFSSWYNQAEGTVATEYDIVSTTGTFAACSLNDNTNNNAIQTYYNAANAQYQVLAASSNQVQLLVASSTNIKTAFSYKLNDFAVSFNAGVALTDTSGVVPTVNQLRLGAIASGAAYLNGHLKSFKFFSKRFINTYLQSLTQ